MPPPLHCPPHRPDPFQHGDMHVCACVCTARPISLIPSNMGTFMCVHIVVDGAVYTGMRTGEQHNK